jgi:hypothetical protein
MRHVRRVLGTVAAALLVVCATLAPPAPARAQGTGVALQLLHQSPWSSAYHRSTLNLELLASNARTEALGHLQLVVSFGPRLATQTDLENLLDAAPTPVIATQTKDIRGDIPAGGARTVSIAIDLASIAAIDQTDAQTYPATVQLTSGGSVLASLVTPVIYLVRPPVAPMLASTWVELSAPVAFGPAGQLTDPSFAASLAPGGLLRAPVSALDSTVGGRHAHGVFDFVLDPLVITQAREVAAGFTSSDGTEVGPTDPAAKQAARFVQTMSSVATTPDRIETVAEPYAAPLLPAMRASGLDTELAAERAAGITIVSSLGSSPAYDVARPPQGSLSDQALDWLAGVQTSVVLANADTVDRSVIQTASAPAPTVPVSTASGPMTMVLPDPSVQALFDRSDLLADPVRAAQVVLGELAVIWKQQPVPSPPTVRGVAVAPPLSVPAALWKPLLDRLAGAPFLTSVTAHTLVDDVSPEVPNTELPLAKPSLSSFDPVYAGEIQRQSDRVEAFGSMVPEEPDTATELRRKLFLATVPEATVDTSVGQPWIDAVNATTQHAFDVVTPSVSPVFTLTSQEGTIPLVMGDPGDTPLHATIELQSNSVTFPDGNTQSVTVSSPGQVVTFRVLATSSGQNPIQIRVRAPNGRAIADPITIQVRSTAANRIALLVTMLAAGGLLLLYSRRWWRRRMNPGSAATT